MSIMKINKKNVLSQIEKNRDKIKSFGVKSIGLFGSVLKGKNTKKSDVDILVNFDKPSFDNYAYTLILLEKILKSRIDLITESSLRPEMKYIKKEVKYAGI